MQTVTIHVNLPDEAAQTWAQMPAADRAAYLARVNDFAVSTLGEPEQTYHLLDADEGEPTSEADALLVAEAFRAHQAGENKGTSPREAAARLSAKYGFQNPLP